MPLLPFPSHRVAVLADLVDGRRRHFHARDPPDTPALQAAARAPRTTPSVRRVMRVPRQQARRRSRHTTSEESRFCSLGLLGRADSREGPNAHIRVHVRDLQEEL